MKAKIGIGKERKRVTLGKVLPLETPFTAYINPSTLCNFKCSYCTHSKSDEEMSKLGFIQKNISWENFIKAIDQLKQFPQKLKLVYLYGNGEPLCNPQFADMVRYIKEANVTEKIETITNGYLLTKENSLKIIDAGLDRIKISIQGVNREQYEKVSNVNIDFDELVEKIRFFYENRKQCKMYIKIIDIGLNENDKKRFYEIFGDITDEIYIESITYTQRTMDEYSTLNINDTNLYGEPLPKCNVCGFPFYILRVGVNGEINPCFEAIFNKNKIVNINNMTLSEYWNSDILRNFRIMQLKDGRHNHPLCNDCNCLISTTLKEDIIDDYVEEILERMGEIDNECRNKTR